MPVSDRQLAQRSRVAERLNSMTTMSIQSTTVPRRLRLAAVITSLFAVAGVLAGCSSGAPYYEGAVEAPAQQNADAGGDGSVVYEEGGFDPAKTASEDRDVIITGSMYMTVEQPIEAADRAASIVRDAGGRIDSRRENAPSEGYGGAAELTLRIPSGQLDAVVDRLRELGAVDEYSTNVSDVTNEVDDLEARISTLRASTARIEALMVDAVDISDIILLEDELARRQGELESLEARQRGLDDQVSMSTIYLSLTTEPVVIVDDDPETFLDGLEAGWNALVGFVQFALVILGVLLPWLAVLAILTFGTIGIVRAARSSKARHAAEPAGPTEAQMPAKTTTPKK